MTTNQHVSISALGEIGGETGEKELHTQSSLATSQCLIGVTFKVGSILISSTNGSELVGGEI